MIVITMPTPKDPLLKKYGVDSTSSSVDRMAGIIEKAVEVSEYFKKHALLTDLVILLRKAIY